MDMAKRVWIETDAAYGHGRTTAGPVRDRRGLTCDLLFGQYGTFPIDRAQRLFIRHIETDTLRCGCLREFHREHLTQSEVAAACGAIVLFL